jgi:WD40 repeat protein
MAGVMVRVGRALWLFGMVACVGAFDARAADPPDRPYLQLELGAHAGPIRRIAVDEQRGIIVTASDDKTARVWDLRSGELRRTLRPPIGPGVLGRLYGAAIHPQQAIVAVAGTTSLEASGHAIYLFDLDSGRMLRRFDARTGDVKRLLWSPDGSMLVAAYQGNHGIKAFDVNGRLVYEDNYRAGCYGLDFSSQGLLAATSLDGRLRLYRATGTTLRLERTIETRASEQFSVAFAPDGRQLVVGYAVQAGAEIFDVASGNSVRRLQPPGLDPGEDVRSVTWTRDGKFIVLGGRDAIGTREATGTPRFVLSRYAVADDRFVASVAVGRDTLLDLVALRDGGVAYASLDGTWGVLAANDAARVARPAFPDLRGASYLALGADARRVGWRFAFGAEPAWFDFATRVVERGEAREVAAPKTRTRLLSSAADWEDTFTPTVNGTRIALEAGEISRAVAAAGDDAFLGTSAALHRIDAKGKVLWRTRTVAEVRAVNVSGDAHLVVTAHADGTLRWWRGSDGAELLALFALPDRRWVAWTPDGYFDASAGADTLVGWHVNRGTAEAADFFSLGRFRERFHRPGVIDLVFRTGDVRDAVADDERQRREQPSDAIVYVVPAPPRATSPTPLKALPPPPAPPVVAQQLPPALVALGATQLVASGSALEVPFALRTTSTRADIAVEMRIDGRPVTPIEVTLPRAFDGSAAGAAKVAVPATGVVSLQLIARDRFGFSEPLVFRIEVAQKPAAPVTPAPPARKLPRLFVLAVGISEFRQPEYNLVLASKDARDFTAAVSKQKGGLYSDVATRVLLNREATRNAVLDGLRWLTESTQPGDVAMLFLAGHGVNTAGGTYYFVPHDGEFNRLEATGVPESAVRDALRAIRGRTLFFIDTCHAGNAVGNYRNASRELARFANSLASAENGVVVFASSTGRQNAEESDDWGNGAFTKALVEGLGGKADLTRKGQVTFKALDYFVSEEVRRLTSGRQTPVTIIPVGVPDFALALSKV